MFLRALHLLFWLAVVFTLSMALLPAPPTVPGDLGDKLHHIIAFTTLTTLAVLAFGTTRPILIALCLAGLGALIELMQMLPMLGRTAQISDWLADCAAIFAVLSLVQLQRLLSAVVLRIAGVDICDREL